MASTLQKFGWIDYIVFFMILKLCVIFGLYRSSFYHSSLVSYLQGGKNMGVLPIGLSLAISFINGITLLQVTGEVYKYGIQQIYIIFPAALTALVAQKIFLPALYNMHDVSIYTYLEKRFGKFVRMLAAFLFLIYSLLWMPLSIYIPLKALHQVSGINVEWMLVILLITCTIYTCLGGFKTVIWTNVFQSLLLIGFLIFISLHTTLKIGGFSKVFEKNWNSGRIEAPNVDIDPLERKTFWSLLFGGSIYMMQSCVMNQSMMMKYFSLPDIKQAKKSLWISVIAFWLVTALTVYCGLVVYAAYYACDPLTAEVSASHKFRNPFPIFSFFFRRRSFFLAHAVINDLQLRAEHHLLPLFFADVATSYPGCAGVFAAVALGASLSSLSSSLLAATSTLEDFKYLKLCFKTSVDDSDGVTWMKWGIIFLGFVNLGIAYLINDMESILVIFISIAPAIGGVCLSLFIMGFMVPWVHSKAVSVGAIISLTLTFWICSNSHIQISNGFIKYNQKPVSIEGCNYNFTKTYNIYGFNKNEEDIFLLFRISPLYHTAIGVLISMSISLIASFIMEPLDPRDVDAELLAPFARRLIPPRKYPNQPSDGIIYAYELPSR